MRSRVLSFLAVAMLAASACYRYVDTTRQPDCIREPLTHSYFRQAPDSNPAGIVHGRVLAVDADGKAVSPIHGAVVRVQGSAQMVATDTAGRFRLDSLPPGRRALRTNRIGYRARLDSVTVDARTGAVVEIGLRAEPLDGCPGFMVVLVRKRVWRWPWQ